MDVKVFARIGCLLVIFLVIHVVFFDSNGNLAAPVGVLLRSNMLVVHDPQHMILRNDTNTIINEQSNNTGASATVTSGPGVVDAAHIAVQLFDYTEVGGRSIRFRGSEELHMSWHSCVGILRFNKTCVFKNLVYSGRESNLDSHAVWEYWVSAPPNITQAEVTALQVKIQQDTMVYLHSILSAADGLVGTWQVNVRVFRRQAAGSVKVARSSLQPDAHSRGLSAWPDGRFSVENAYDYPIGSTIYDEFQKEKYYGQCGARTEEMQDVPCLAPGIDYVFAVPATYAMRSVPWNIGHTMFDDHLPWFTAIHDLGLLEYARSFVQLYTDVPGYMRQGWSNKITKATYRGVVPNHHPIMYFELGQQVAGSDVLFRTIVAGMCGRSPHSVTPGYSVYGIEYRSMALWREHYLTNLGMKHLDQDWSKATSIPRINIVMLQKPDKRRIRNMEEIVQSCRAELPDANIEVIDWAQLGGHLNEVNKTLQTHILLGVDGTGMMGTFLLPPGAVYISIPTGGTRGYPSHLGDFMINGNDHIRIMYYDKLSPGEYNHDIQSDLIIPPRKLLPFLHEAVKLVREKFVIPTPFMTNHSPAARQFVRLLNTYPEHHSRMSHARADGGSLADWFAHNPKEFWNTVIGPPAPALLSDIVSGKVGNPPTWTGP